MKLPAAIPGRVLRLLSRVARGRFGRDSDRHVRARRQRSRYAKRHAARDGRCRSWRRSAGGECECSVLSLAKGGRSNCHERGRSLRAANSARLAFGPGPAGLDTRRKAASSSIITKRRQPSMRGSTTSSCDSSCARAGVHGRCHGHCRRAYRRGTYWRRDRPFCISGGADRCVGHGHTARANGGNDHNPLCVQAGRRARLSLVRESSSAITAAARAAEIG